LQTITTFLTFQSRGKEAVAFYLSVFKDSELHSSMEMPGSGQLLHAAFSLNGQQFMAMEADSPNFTFGDGYSLFVSCETQEEVDYYWDSLAADGGQPGRCGWLKDKFGVSWQIVPNALGELMSTPDREAGDRTMQAMMQMNKLDIQVLRDAAAGKA
jgi:predicted 3-demethylubiquinone-9 3-methyltransferase (glyoxalase superfamily)